MVKHKGLSIEVADREFYILYSTSDDAIRIGYTCHLSIYADVYLRIIYI